jgi:hypothetical protein
VCGKAITDTQEHEVEGDGLAPVALAHPDCYRVWREESRRMKSSQRTSENFPVRRKTPVDPPH